jgi:cyclopropane fatty-acyl-phospholipid synthase-like methyltransferase
LSFDLLFKASKDPWGYQDSEYEAKKRESLLDSMPSDFELLLEIGSADGHNLMAIEAEHPDTRLVGIDISSEAIQRARERSKGTIDFQRAVPGISQRLRQQYGTFDVLVFSEMLYYIGSKSAWKELLTPMKTLIRPGTIVVAVHPASDAAILHDRLAEILELEVLSNRYYPDESRPYEIRILTLPKG